MLIKRVIAIEGDTVFTRPPYPFKTEVVPPGHVWVEGDDGFHSIDSNTYGPVRDCGLACQLLDTHRHLLTLWLLCY
jgi:mitochondrial inner membrane protease subunit 2